jgi:hypothetical protein
MKGISREVVPYAITGMIDADGETVQVFSEHAITPHQTRHLCRYHRGFWRRPLPQWGRGVAMGSEGLE